MKKVGRLVHCIVLAALWPVGACTQALLGDDEYVRGDESGVGGGGGGGGCENGRSACGAECVALESDPAHCGSCDRDCGGTTCQQGVCEPAVVVGGVTDPQSIAIDDTHVYWTTAGGLVQRALKSGGPIETLAEDQESPETIVVDDKRVFWLNRGTGAVMRKNKGASSKPKVLSNGMGARALAQDALSVYYSRKLKKGDIRVVQKGGGGPVTLTAGQPLPAELHVRGSSLFWAGFSDADDDLNHNSIPDGEEGLSGGYIRSMPRLGGDGVTLAAGEGEISALTSLGEIAVWADRTNTRIRAFSPAEGGPVTLVADQDVRGLTADEGAIYWSTGGGNVKSRTAQGTLSLLALDVTKAGPLVVDATHVYLLQTGANGAVLRFPK
jgi:hypothetical protein